MEREIRTINMFGKECRIQKIGDNLWDFLDLPVLSNVYDTWDIAKKYNSNCDGKNNNLDKLIPQIKSELEKNNLKIGKIWIPSKEEYEGGISFYSEPDNRIKFYDGDSYWYWTSTPGPDDYYYWYSVHYDGYLSWYNVFVTIGVSFAFYINEIDTNETIIPVKNNINDKMPEDVKEEISKLIEKENVRKETMKQIYEKAKLKMYVDNDEKGNY